jgi:hypothetical protein
LPAEVLARSGIGYQISPVKQNMAALCGYPLRQRYFYFDVMDMVNRNIDSFTANTLCGIFS